jgi:hypothetical protein
MVYDGMVDTHVPMHTRAHTPTHTHITQCDPEI